MVVRCHGDFLNDDNMGNVLKPCRSCRRGSANKDIVLLLVGLDQAGKTRTAEVLQGRIPEGSGAPTVGFQARRLRHRGRTICLHDVGGGVGFRGAWPHYFTDAHGLLFVLDAADRERLPATAELLHDVLAHPYVAGKPILILANKQDLDGAMDDLDIVEKLNIEDIVNKYKCPTRVEAYSTTVPKIKPMKSYIDPGLKKGYEWLLNYIIHKYDDINLRVQSDINKENIICLQTKNDDIKTIPNAFENPNYKIEIINKDTQSGDSIIVVQHNMPNNKNVKLSPLFGTRNTSENEPTKSIVELEARSHMRKLSPIPRKRIYPMTSRESIENNPNANEIFANQLKQFKSRENLREDSIPISAKSRITEVSLADNNASPILTTVGNKRILPPIKLESDAIRMVTPKQIINSNVIVEDIIDEKYIIDERPKSASDVVRKQLENVNIPPIHKGKLIKGFRKNRTSPEDNTSLFMFDPDDSDRFDSTDNPETQSEIVVHPSL